MCERGTVLVFFVFLFVIVEGVSVEIARRFRVSVTLELGELNDGGEEKEGHDIPS